MEPSEFETREEIEYIEVLSRNVREMRLVHFG